MIYLTPLLTLIALLDLTSAFSLPITRADTPNPSSTSINFTNAYNMGYLITIEFDGQPIQVLLDTGSSDLWIDPGPTGVDLSRFVNTGMGAGLWYGSTVDSTVAQGPIVVGPVQIGDFKVDKQAFISATGSNATFPSMNDFGILGVAPASLIAFTLVNTSYNGRTFLDNVCIHDVPDEPNYITLGFSRDLIYGITIGGTFTIGEVASDLAAVTKTPPRKVVYTLATFPRWSTTLDGIIVNGKTYNGNSKFNNTFVSAGQTITMLDTGTGGALLPRFYADAIFNDLPGAVFNESRSTYIVPCDTKLNVSFVFGKDEYPLNPMDIFNVVDVSDSGELTCAGAFGVEDLSDVDIVLGDTFLRNVYALFDFGRWATSGTGDPFVQLLSVTNQAQAWNDFDSANTVRLNSYKKLSLGSSGGNTTNNAVPPSPSTLENSNSELLRNSYVILGLLAGVIVLLVLFTLVARGSKDGGHKSVPNVSSLRDGRAMLGDDFFTKSYAYSAP
ncbi:hypothetical protein JAAARDRAFT_193505 [Jaapia argillacea MUCL 33604]|uniref:Peptidase A1 domain-containing protein n=1 Tax=Jaapia argillacea MUCL 33604 TaxID=933084 RepID=A0A067PT83_9AGAM|nr:hypothetical protein JAAARDRAFT_193505 [Jaapia argillacea MUCL 33604]